MRKLDIGNGGSPKLDATWETCDIRPGICDHQVPAWEIADYFGDGVFDSLYACMVLEHIPRNLQKTTLYSWFYSLKAGGILEVIVPDVEYIAQLILCGHHEEGVRLLYGDQGYHEDTHCWGYTVSTLTTALKDVGFKVLEIRGNPQIYAKVTK